MNIRTKLRDWLGLTATIDSIVDVQLQVTKLKQDFETMTNVRIQHKKRLEELERTQAGSHRQLMAQTIALHDVLSGEQPEMYEQVIGRARGYRKRLDQVDNPTMTITQWLVDFNKRVMP